jgi:hypothetical protein
LEDRNDSTASLSRFKTLSFLPWGTFGFASLLAVLWSALSPEKPLGIRLRALLGSALEATPGGAGRVTPEVVRRGLLYVTLGLALLGVLVFLVRWVGWRRKMPAERMGEFKRDWFRGGKRRLPWIRIVLALLAYGTRYGLEKKPDLVSTEDFAAVYAAVDALALGLVFWAGGGLVRWLTRLLSVPSGKKMDSWLRELIEDTGAQSLEKLGLVADELTKEAIILLGLVEDLHLIPEEDRWIRKGKDKVIRYTPLSLTVLQFTERHLGVYRCVLNYVRAVQLDERTDEFFYQDVVSVATKRESHAYTLYGEKVEEALHFSLAVSSGDRVTQTLPIGEMEGFVTPVSTQAEHAVNNIRQMLRDKK